MWVQSFEEVKRVLKKVLWGCVAAELVIGQFMCTGPKKMHACLHHSLNKIKPICTMAISSFGWWCFEC
jgi:glucose uptake protein GlcU